MLPVMSMTPPNITTSSTLITEIAPLKAPAVASAVVMHEFLWCVFQCDSFCGLSLNEHRSALRGTFRVGFTGVPNSLNLELCACYGRLL